MTPENAPTSVCFFQLLRADASGLLERHAARLASLPSELAAQGYTFDELSSGVSAACTPAGVPAGVPDRAGAARAAALASGGYRAEAASQARSGRSAQALLFLGRALEAAGIASSIAALNSTYGRGQPLSPRRLKCLLTAAAPALLADAAVWVSRVSDAYLCTVETARSGAGVAPSSPAGSPPPPSAAFVAGLVDDAAATVALKARLQALARGRGTLPTAPPVAAAAAAAGV